MANKPIKVPAIGAKLTEAEKKEQATRAFYQKRNSLAEGILFNCLHGGGGTRIDRDGNPDYKPAVTAALEAADFMMEKVYGVAVKIAEE